LASNTASSSELPRREFESREDLTELTELFAASAVEERP
jgi:hypothetical protein